MAPIPAAQSGDVSAVAMDEWSSGGDEAAEVGDDGTCCTRPLVRCSLTPHNRHDVKTDHCRSHL